ncbi:MAG: cytochrome c-type biogenesis protein CcmH, partial [Porphyrobacter sp.]|nr:cytochrome c-type biogenesis protein CcmH [Porphyrobacter sp.]
MRALVALLLALLAIPALAQDTMPPAPYAYNQLDDPRLEAEATA